MNKEVPIIAVTMGDPAGIGPEIMVKAVTNKNLNKKVTPLLIGDLAILKRAAGITGVEFEPKTIKDLKDLRSDGNYYLIDMKNVDIDSIKPGQPGPDCSHALMDYIKKGVELSLTGYAKGITTCPINKEVMNMGGYNYPGHTELLAELTKTDKFAMMMAGGGLKIVLLTIHVALNKVFELITTEAIYEKIMLTNSSIKKLYAMDKPRIGVASLNPHAGEGGMFGNEEAEIIVPAIEKARKNGINVSGPVAGDTLFYSTLKGEFDAVLAMYHDQGLIPLKTVAFDTGVNVTLGLPIIRTSVDHGTAYELAGSGKASENSLVEALLLASDFARNEKVEQ